MIAKAPVETDLAVTSSLEVHVEPRRWWSRGEAPSVDGTGEVGLVLRLTDGAPYRVESVAAADLRHRERGE